MEHLTANLGVYCNKRDRFQPETLHVAGELTLNTDARDTAGSSLVYTSVFTQY